MICEDIRELVVYTLESTGLKAHSFRREAVLWEALASDARACFA